MTAKLVNAIGYFTDELGKRKFNYISDNGRWFESMMKKRSREGKLLSLNNVHISTLEKPMAKTDLNKLIRDNPDTLNTLAPDNQDAMVSKFDKLIDDIKRRHNAKETNEQC